MPLPYPITSYAGRVVDLTGGKMDRAENAIIRIATNTLSFVNTYNVLSKLNERELNDIGLKRPDIYNVAKHCFKAA